MPPSIILVLYAAIAELSVPKLLAAGLIPGLLLTVLYIAVALVVVRMRPHYAPGTESFSWRERFAALRGPWQFMVLFIVSIGGIYAGIFSPTEAASIGALGAILLGELGRRLSMKELRLAVGRSVVVSALLFVIANGANLFSFFIVQTHLPELLLASARTLDLSGPTVVMRLIRSALRLGYLCAVRAGGLGCRGGARDRSISRSACGCRKPGSDALPLSQAGRKQRGLRGLPAELGTRGFSLRHHRQSGAVCRRSWTHD